MLFVEGMSALGQKQTCAVQLGMSALPPKADIDSPDAMLANLNWLGRALSLAGRYAPRHSTAP